MAESSKLQTFPATITGILQPLPERELDFTGENGNRVWGFKIKLLISTKFDTNLAEIWIDCDSTGVRLVHFKEKVGKVLTVQVNIKSYKNPAFVSID